MSYFADLWEELRGDSQSLLAWAARIAVASMVVAYIGLVVYLVVWRVAS